MDIGFREVEKQDYPAICSLIEDEHELYRIYPNGRYPLTSEQLEQLATIRKDLTVAIHNADIIGFANLYDFKEKHHAFIGNVVIRKDLRGKCLGKQLVQYMLDIAFNKYQLPTINISVFSDNTPALLLYSAIGFAPYAIEPRWDTNNKKLALIHMKMEHNQQRRI